MQLLLRKSFLVIMDSIFIVGSLWMSYLIHFEWYVSDEAIKIFLSTFYIALIIKLLWYKVFHLYTSLWRYASIKELRNIVFANIAASLTGVFLNVILNLRTEYSVIIVSFFISTALTGGLRFAYRYVRQEKQHINNHNSDRIRVMIVGAGEAGSILIKELQGIKSNEYVPVLVLDDDVYKANKTMHGVPIKFGTFKLADYAKSYRINEIIIAIPSATEDRINELIALTEHTQCSIKVVPGLLNYLSKELAYKVVRPLIVKSDKSYRDIQFSPPDITDIEIQEVVNALKSGWITTGPRTKEFERKIAKYIGVNKAVALNSATAAMELVLRIMGIGPGDEVITTAYTYTASASIIDHVGAKIVLVDTAPYSFEMDYDKLAETISEKTKMIIPVDLGGKMCDYDRIFAILEDRKALFKANNEYQSLINRIIVMSDAAHAFGSSSKGKKCGQVADFTCFSFHAVKNLTTAEGGAVVWRNDLGFDDEMLYKQFMLLSLHGQSKDALAKNIKGSWEYDIVYPAYKCNMTDIVAGLGLAQLSRYPDLLKRRREIIELYDHELLSHGVQRLDHYGDDFESSGHLYLARIEGVDVDQRNQIITYLAEFGIATNVHYKPLPMFTAYKNLGFKIEDFPNAYSMYENEITLPLHTYLTNDDVVYITTKLKEAVEKITQHNLEAVNV